MPFPNAANAGVPPCSSTRVSLTTAALIPVVAIIFPLFILICDYFLFNFVKRLQAKNIKIMVIGDKKDMLPNSSTAHLRKKSHPGNRPDAKNLEPGTGSPERKI
jgi:hypothetical protein